jgi:hypothetical protein
MERKRNPGLRRGNAERIVPDYATAKMPPLHPGYV